MWKWPRIALRYSLNIAIPFTHTCVFTPAPPILLSLFLFLQQLSFFYGFFCNSSHWFSNCGPLSNRGLYCPVFVQVPGLNAYRPCWLANLWPLILPYQNSEDQRHPRGKFTCMMAWLKRPTLCFDTKWKLTLAAPALSPNMVILSASPPKPGLKENKSITRACHMFRTKSS